MADASNLGLGRIITTPQHRDAIHIAVAPVVAAEPLSAGTHIGFVDNERQKVGTFASCIGVVDPFFKGTILPGQLFWMYLYPGSITSLRHEWTHPLFDSDEPLPEVSEELTAKKQMREQAEKELQRYASEFGMSIEALLDAAHRWIMYGEYTIDGGRFEGCYVPAEFWDYYEAYTCTEVLKEDRDSFFSCSC